MKMKTFDVENRMTIRNRIDFQIWKQTYIHIDSEIFDLIRNQFSTIYWNQFREQLGKNIFQELEKDITK